MGRKGTELIHRGVTFQVEHVRDDDHAPPWEDDGRGVVTDWIDSGDAPEGARRLGYEQRDGTARYFDWEATLAKAIAEGWGDPDLRDISAVPYPHATVAERATAAEFKFLDGWASDEWEYVGVVVTIPDTGLRASLWGVESDAGDYLGEVARELADQILDEDLEVEYQRIEGIARAAGVVLERGQVGAGIGVLGVLST